MNRKTQTQYLDIPPALRHGYLESGASVFQENRARTSSFLSLVLKESESARRKKNNFLVRRAAWSGQDRRRTRQREEGGGTREKVEGERERKGP